MKRFLFAVFCAFGTCWAMTACSAGSAPISDSARDPSNPAAPSAAIAAARPPSPPTLSLPLQSGDADAALTQGPLVARGPASSSATEVTYTCPMHPEVISKAPGNCPKCGMTLVVKK